MEPVPGNLVYVYINHKVEKLLNTFENVLKTFSIYHLPKLRHSTIFIFHVADLFSCSLLHQKDIVLFIVYLLVDKWSTLFYILGYLLIISKFLIGKSREDIMYRHYSESDFCLIFHVIAYKVFLSPISYTYICLLWSV